MTGDAQDFSPGWLDRKAEKERLQLEAELPLRQAFLHELNELCLRYGAHISDTGLEYKAMVVLSPKRYVLEDLQYVEVVDP